MRARVRLWLRSERAMGLDALPLRARRLSADTRIHPPRTRQLVAAGPAVAPPPRLAASSDVATAPAPASPPATLTPPVAARAFFNAADSQPLAPSNLSHEDRIAALSALDAEQVRNCSRCRLCEQRTQTVFGEGDASASVFFIGEGPGEVEDRTGRPFVGPAGQKLDEMVGAMGLKREQVYIANIVKCRPPQNRAPMPDEVEACFPYLRRQLEIVNPRVIVTLGLPATKAMTGASVGITRLRGTWHEWRGIRLMPTFHPAYILRNYTVDTRRAVWSDLQKVMTELGIEPKKKHP